VESGLGLIFQRGVPYADPSKCKWYTVESDEFRLRFDNFYFAKGTERITLDGSDVVVLPGCLDERATEVRRVELSTETVEVGSMIHLREFSQFKDGALIERKAFPLHWCPQSPTPTNALS